MSRRRRGRSPRISWSTLILAVVVVLLGGAVLNSAGWGAVLTAVGVVSLLLLIGSLRGRRKSRRRHS